MKPLKALQDNGFLACQLSRCAGAYRRRWRLDRFRYGDALLCAGLFVRSRSALIIVGERAQHDGGKHYNGKHIRPGHRVVFEAPKFVSIWDWLSHAMLLERTNAQECIHVPRSCG